MWITLKNDKGEEIDAKVERWTAGEPSLVEVNKDTLYAKDWSDGKFRPVND